MVSPYPCLGLAVFRNKVSFPIPIKQPISSGDFKEQKMEQAIQISGLVKNYGKVKALRGLDFKVAPGKIYGLLGPNGAGKSTLIKTLVGVVKPTAGSVQVLGNDMPRHARAARKRLGYMPQIPALYDDMSVKANVIFFARAHNLKNVKKRVDQVLEFVGLAHLVDRRTATLSGGLKQRCSLACALVHDPVLLLLDEPTAGVDPVLKEGFWQHFRELAAKGVTIIISTHLMDEPLACDRIGILRKGNLLLEDTAENILARGKTRIILNVGGKPITAEIDNENEDLPMILLRYGLEKTVSKIRLERPSLEDVFIKLVAEETHH